MFPTLSYEGKLWQHSVRHIVFFKKCTALANQHNDQYNVANYTIDLISSLLRTLCINCWLNTRALLRFTFMFCCCKICWSLSSPATNEYGPLNQSQVFLIIYSVYRVFELHKCCSTASISLLCFGWKTDSSLEMPNWKWFIIHFFIFGI